jgi:hypothetical protein
MRHCTSTDGDSDFTRTMDRLFDWAEQVLDNGRYEALVMLLMSVATLVCALWGQLWNCWYGWMECVLWLATVCNWTMYARTDACATHAVVPVDDEVG